MTFARQIGSQPARQPARPGAAGLEPTKPYGNSQRNASLELTLAAIEPALAVQFRAVTLRIQERGPDWLTQAAASCRKFLLGLLHNGRARRTRIALGARPKNSTGPERPPYAPHEDRLALQVDPEQGLQAVRKRRTQFCARSPRTVQSSRSRQRIPGIRRLVRFGDHSRRVCDLSYRKAVGSSAFHLEGTARVRPGDRCDSRLPGEAKCAVGLAVGPPAGSAAPSEAVSAPADCGMWTT